VSKGSGKNNSLEVRNENNSLTDTNKINTYRVSENELNPSEKTFDSAKNTRKKITLKRSSAPFTPLPYRITIKLSGTNPSAPAELLTKALRSAGLKFEVERIERVEKRSPGHQKLDRGLRR